MTVLLLVAVIAVMAAGILEQLRLATRLGGKVRRAHSASTAAMPSPPRRWHWRASISCWGATPTA